MDLDSNLRYKVGVPKPVTEKSHSCVRLTDTTVLLSPVWFGRVSRLRETYIVSVLKLVSRIFELFMAFDALRMRNVVQLVGLLCTECLTYRACFHR